MNSNQQQTKRFRLPVMCDLSRQAARLCNLYDGGVFQKRMVSGDRIMGCTDERDGER